MNLAKVIGTVVCTIKDPSLTGKKILLIRPVDRIGDSCGPVKVAIDSMGAGPGEFVFYVTGKEAAFPWHPDLVASDCSIVGILDRTNFSEIQI